MKTAILVLGSMCLNAACLTLSAQDSPASRMLDPKLNIAQRNDACYELRGAHSPEVIAALARALESPLVRSCAARNLREAGAIDELNAALSGDDPEVRAAAARELGVTAKPELMELLAQTARDPNLMVASNAFEGLTFYQDRGVLPYLLDLAAGGGPVAAMALSRAVEFADPGVLPVARRMMATNDVPLRLAALRAIGDLGNSSDLPALRVLAAKAESATPGGRGFGLMPALDLSRAAQNAIHQIEQRM
jgi:HEAT repeat protein